jgi:hypothetical protein
MQYVQRSEQRSVSDIRRSVAVLPKASMSAASADDAGVAAMSAVELTVTTLPVIRSLDG